MRDYDVIVIGGGINGLTAAAYLAKAGLSTAVFEARGQCGAHCDALELRIPGFLHNTHTVWLMPALSPAMGRPRPRELRARSLRHRRALREDPSQREERGAGT